MKNCNVLSLKFISTSLLIAIFFVFFTQESFAVTFTRKPFLQNVTSNSAEIRWVTDTHETLTVKYGTSTSYGSQTTSDTVTGTGGPHNHVRISGLSANTKYFYQIVSSGGTALTPAGDQTYYIQTAPATGSTTPFTWAIWGDSGSRGSVNADDVFRLKPNLTIVAGDVGYPYSADFNNNNTQYFNVYTQTQHLSPFYVTCGNHETSCPTMIADHSLPGSGNMGGQTATYSFDYGNVHFVSLNSNGSRAFNATNPTSSDPQMRWAYADLRASNQPWKVVFWHHNGWSAASHSTDQSIVDNMIKMSDAAGADLVIWGHSHGYERWNRKPGFYPNVQAFTIGNGGQHTNSSCTATSPGPGCAAKGSGEAGFLLGEVNGNTMTMKYYTQNGTVADSVTLSSNGTGPTGQATTTPTRTPTAGPTSGTQKPGDVNRDNLVNILDFQLLSNTFGKSSGQSGYNDNADFVNDNVINILDFQVLSNNFGR